MRVTDLFHPTYEYEHFWTEVEQCDGVVAAAEAPGALMFIWPFYRDNWAARALGDYKGKTVIYVGELKGGCCAEDAFFEVLEDWRCCHYVELPTVYGIHDALYVYERSRRCGLKT
jgi:hypothetical protein